MHALLEDSFNHKLLSGSIPSQRYSSLPGALRYPYRNKEHTCSKGNCQRNQDGLLMLRWQILTLKNDISLSLPDKNNPGEQYMRCRRVKRVLT